MASAPAEQVNLEAKSPYEMRVHLGEQVPDMDVRSALKTGDMGFLHSYTTGSAVDGPGIRVVAWTTACMFRCQYCHNPDTWTLSNGIPVTLEQRDRGSAQICQCHEGDAWRLHAVRGRAADAGPLRRPAVRRGQGHGRSHGDRDQRLLC